jgi:predicted amidohydrolase
MRIALAQYSMSPEVPANLEKALHLVSEAAGKAADLILFPELCVTPFFPQYSQQDVGSFAATVDSEIVRKFQDVCRALRISAIPNLYLSEGGRRYDASLLIDQEGALRGISKMVHIAQLPCFFEQDYYTPSDTGFRVYETAHGAVGMVICFDRHYPESIRTCALRGASLVVIPTANVMEEPRDVFECELRASAFQNGVFIAMCNRVGQEGNMQFCGESTVVGPAGEVIAKAGTSEELLMVEIDLAKAAVARRDRPYLSLRRPEMYA